MISEYNQCYSCNMNLSKLSLFFFIKFQQFKAIKENMGALLVNTLKMVKWKISDINNKIVNNIGFKKQFCPW